MRNGGWVAVVGLLVAVAPSAGWVWFDNPLPVVTLRINRASNDVTSAVGYVEAIRLHKCSGGFQDFAVEQTLDLKNTYTKTVGAGDWCGVSVRWGSNVEITNGSWTVEYSEPYTALALDGNPATENTTLTPYDVTHPAFSGGAPRLFLTMQ